ncbi:hypothetical protein EON66_02540 [archaeon]|nr:MAG: hypothetical protein EON66_02540 [archaeon]
MLRSPYGVGVQAIKTFTVGDHVKVIGGAYMGETGTVIDLRHIEGGTCCTMHARTHACMHTHVLLKLYARLQRRTALRVHACMRVQVLGACGHVRAHPRTPHLPFPSIHAAGDGTEASKTWIAVVRKDSGVMRDLDVFVRDLTISKEVASRTGATLEGYALYDMVEMPSISEGSMDAGVIVGLGTSDVTVLMPTGITKSVPVLQLRGKVDRRRQTARAADHASRPITQGNLVHVVDGPHRGSSGTVKYIFNTNLFLHSLRNTSNAGMFVVRPRHVEVADTRAPDTNEADGSSMRPPTMMGRARSSPYEALLNKTVIVTKGLYKKRVCVVKQVAGNNVSLSAQGVHRMITVPGTDVRLFDAVAPESRGAGTCPLCLCLLYTLRSRSSRPTLFPRIFTPAGGVGMGAQTPGYIGLSTPAVTSSGASSTYGALSVHRTHMRTHMLACCAYAHSLHSHPHSYCVCFCAMCRRLRRVHAHARYALFPMPPPPPARLLVCHNAMHTPPCARLSIADDHCVQVA